MDEKLKTYKDYRKDVADLQKQLYFTGENAGKSLFQSRRFLDEKNFGQCYFFLDQYINYIEKLRETGKIMANVILQYQNALKEE